MSTTCLSLFIFIITIIITIFTTKATSSTLSFIFGGCTQYKYTQGSGYEYTANSILASLVNSAKFSNYNKFSITTPPSDDTVHGLFQCRGDLTTEICSQCVARAVSQLGTLCPNSCGGALQLDGCFVKYDNASFFGVEDKTVVVRKCGPSIGYDSNLLSRRDALMGYLGANDGSSKPYRTGESGGMQGVAQCVGDLGASQCQDCLVEAIGRLKSECGPAVWGDMFLAKCYVRYSEGGVHSHGGKGFGDDHDNNDNEIEKTLAILVGLIAGVGLLIVFSAFLRKICEKGGK